MATPLSNLPVGARFITEDRTEYKVTAAASTHPRGSVEVRNLSMTDDDVARLLETPGAVEPGCDPRDGLYVDGQAGMLVEVIA